MDIQINLGLALVIIALLFALVAIFWISTQQSKNQPEKKPSILYKTIIVSLVIIVIILAIIYVSGREPTKWHYLAMVAVIFLVFLVNLYEASKFKMKDPIEIKEEQLHFLWRFAHAEPDTCTFGITSSLFKINEVPGGRIFDVLAYGLYKTKIGYFLVTSNPYENYVMGALFNPPLTLVSKIWDDSIARRYDAERQEMIQELEDQKNAAKVQNNL